MRARLLQGALLVFVVCFAVFALVHIFPPAPYGLADDWRVFVAAAHLAQQGVSPYDAAPIHAAEQAAQHYPSVQPSLDDFTDLPLVAVALRAFAWLPYWVSFAVFTSIGVAAVILSMRTWMRACGWRRTAPWLLGSVCCWPVLLGFFSGQFDALLLAGLVGSLLMLRRGSPGLAGVCMAAVLLKPHLLWPLPLLLFACWWPERARAWRFAAAGGAVLAVGTVLGFTLVPGSSAFFGHLVGFTSRVSSVQPDLSGLPGMLQHLPAGTALTALVASAGVAGVAALAVIAARSPRVRESFEVRATLVLTGVAVWLLCAPYAHPNDDVLLLPLLVVLAGVEGRSLDARALQLGIAASLLLVAAFIAGPAAGLAATALAVGCLVALRDRLTPARAAGIALPAFVILPTVWPFHLLTLPITPLAIGLVVLAGALLLRDELRGMRSVREGERRRRVLGVVVEAAT